MRNTKRSQPIVVVVALNPRCENSVLAVENPQPKETRMKEVRDNTRTIISTQQMGNRYQAKFTFDQACELFRVANFKPPTFQFQSSELNFKCYRHIELEAYWKGTTMWLTLAGYLGIVGLFPQLNFLKLDPWLGHLCFLCFISMPSKAYSFIS